MLAYNGATIAAAKNTPRAVCLYVQANREVNTGAQAHAPNKQYKTLRLVLQRQPPLLKKLCLAAQELIEHHPQLRTMQLK